MTSHSHSPKRVKDARRFGGLSVNSHMLAGLVTLAVLLAAFWSTWKDLVGVWLGSSTYQHGMAVPAIVAFMLWRRRGELANITPKASATGVLVAILGCVLWITGEVAAVSTLQHLALLILVHAVILSAWGGAFYRAAFFPLAVLVLAVPFGDFAIRPLQTFTADWSVALVRAVGIPVFREGWEIAIPGALFKVAEVCAGLRYIVAGLVLGTLVSEVFEQRWPSRIIFLVLCVIIPVVGNALRAFFIIWLAYISDLRLAVGADHLVYGWIFFGFLSVLIIYCGYLLRGEPSRSTERSRSYSWKPLRLPQWAMLGLTLVIALGTGAAAFAPTGPASLPSGLVTRGPVASETWESHPVESQFRPKFPDAAAMGEWRYTRDGESVDVYLALFGERGEMIGSRNSLAGSGEVSGILSPIDGGALDNVSLSIVRASAKRWLVGNVYWVDGHGVSDERLVKLRRAKVHLFGGTPLAAALVVATPLDGAVDSNKALLLQEFLHDLDFVSYMQQLVDKAASAPESGATKGG